MDFEKSIFENSKDRILVCAHRGVSGADIPCNTLPAFKAALMHGADMIELDVALSRDGEHFVFHPGMERAHLDMRSFLITKKSSKIKKLKFVNQDNTKTEYGINTLEEILTFLKGRCYINIDKYWTDIKGITECIRKCGVEKQVIVKTPDEQKYYSEIARYAPDLMFMPIVRKKDEITERLDEMGINCIGAEVLFKSERDPVNSEKYIKSMHKREKIVFANAIVYNYREILSAGHTDDISIIDSPESGWGYLADRGYDVIQTDWCGSVKAFLENHGRAKR